MDKQQLVDALEVLLTKPVEETKNEVNAVKMAFYGIRNTEIEAEKAEFIANGNKEADFVGRTDELETKIKDLLNQLREKRAAYTAALDAEREKNLAQKRAIIDEIKTLSQNADNINKEYSHVQDLRRKFQEIGEVPMVNATEVWKQYQAAVEQFYDMLKLNKELRDYDFKKNYELKQQLCEEAEKLATAERVVDAFRTLQSLHDKWREVGPVAKEVRETIWARFKEASAVVNKRHQQFFEARKESEKQSEAAKTALCEQIEAITTDGLKTYAAWDGATKQIIALQSQWNAAGFASRKANTALYNRFRAVCDDFFSKKAAFFKQMKEEMSSNLEKKLALCEKAEALKDSTDWKKTTEELVALQKEWKTIGSVAKKQSDVVWKRFVSACDYFFEQKGAQTTNVRQVERANLKEKKAVIAGIREQLANATDESAKAVRELMKKWQEIGHVPFKEKDKVYADYKNVVDEAFAKLDMKESKASLANFETSISQLSDNDKLFRERERLVRTYEQSVNELKTFENNLGFFNAKSKTGNTMLQEMERRIAKIKDDISVLKQKITMLDEKLKEA